MPHSFDRNHYMSRLTALVGTPQTPSKSQEIEDLLSAIYGVGYTHGYKAGESDMMDKVCPDVGM